MFFLLFSLIIFIIISALILVYKTWETQNSPNQKLFLAGKIPDPKPNGSYKGSLKELNSIWQGKKFDRETSTGINLFDGKEIYPFKTYIGKGLQDKKLDVLKIDYNISENPFWLRFILDEIVEVGKDKYLGKINLRLIPGISFALGYFRLEK